MADVKLTITGQNLTKQAIDQLKRDLEQTTQRLNAMNQGTAKVEQETRKARTGVMELAVGLGAVSAATMLVVRSGTMAAIQFEKMKLGLAAVAGSAMAANTQMIEFRKLAKMPGLGLPEVVKAATSLQALDMSLSTTTQVIREWGNELVRMGKGRMELDRIVLALTQMIGKGKGFGQEIRQIAEAMPSIRKHMKSAFGTTASEEFEKMGVTAQKFIAGITAELAKMPRVAGGAANAMENFTDAMFNARVAMGEAFLPALTKAMEAAVKFLERFAEMPASFRSMVSWNMLAVGAVTALGAALAGAVFIFDKAIVAAKVFGGALMFLSAHPAVLAAAAITAVVTALGIMIAKSMTAKSAVVDLGKAMSDAKASFDKFSQMDRLINEIGRLRDKKEQTVVETQRLRKAQEELIALEPRMLAFYDNEGKAIAASIKGMKARLEQMREMTLEQLKMAAAEARVRIPELEKDVEERAKKVNELYGESIRLSNLAEQRRKSGLFAERELAERTKNLWESKNAAYKKESEALANSREQLARYKADIEAYEKTWRNMRILGLPPTLDRPTKAISEEERKLIDEIHQLRISRIEDETAKAIAEAEYEAKTKIDEYKALLKAEGIEESKAAALRNAIREQEQTRDFKIAQAKKKQAEEVAKVELKANEERLERMREQNEKDRAFRIAANERLMQITRRSEEEAERENKERLDRMREQNRKSTAFRIATNKRLMEITQRNEEEAARKRKEQLDWLIGRLKEDQEFQKRQQAEILAIVQQAQDAIRTEAARTFDAYYVAENMRISLIDDTTQRELQQARLTYETKVKLIKNELAEAEISFDRRAELERQLAYLKEKYAKDAAAIQARTTDDMLWSVSNAIAELPGEFARALWEARGLGKEFAREFQDLQEETSREVDRINSDYTKSAAQRHRELERLEKESAQRRLEIERRMDEERRGIYSDFVKSFFAQILADMERMLIQQELTPRIFGFLKGLVVPAATVAGGPWAGIAAAAGPMLAGLGFDNPVNDATAREFGRSAAMLYGASFDNPVNDLNAKLVGTRTAAYSLGRRSADDMVEHFTKGFVQEAGTGSARKEDDELKGLLKDLKHALGNPPEFRLIMDGRHVHSVIQPIHDRKMKRGESY